jgi:hypothetical protein
MSCHCSFGKSEANPFDRSDSFEDPIGRHVRRSDRLHPEKFMPPHWLQFRRHLAGVLLGLAALLQVQPLAAQLVTVTSTTATTVWKYSYPGTACIAQDYSDVPVRPVLVGGFWGPTILWFASNANGSYASVGTQAGPDILAGFRRGTANGPGCVSWLPPTSYPGSTPRELQQRPLDGRALHVRQRPRPGAGP